MSDKIPRSVTDAIAEGRTPDWDGAPAEYAETLRQLDLITRAFRADRGEERRPEPLFAWRHLEVMEKIGEGGFGEVYRAYDSVLRRDVALKLDRAAAPEGIEREMVIAEARRMARLRHPNILAIHGADEDGGRVGIWFDLLDGQTLEALLEETGPLSPASALELAIPLANAVALIHRRDLSHGDIKPANIMVLPDGSPVLMDFGAAREAAGLRVATQGSPVVMAPEQFDGRPNTFATDVYALGAVLYHALTGHFPLEGDSADALADQHAAGRRPDLSKVPRTWRGLLGAMLARDPGRRPVSDSLNPTLEHMKTARRRLVRKLSVAAVIASLTAGTVAALLAYRSATQSRDRLERVTDVVVQAIDDALPNNRSGPTSIEVIYDRLATLIEEQLADYPVALADMRVLVGNGLGQLGQGERGLEIAERGMSLMREVRADDPRDLAHGLLKLASLRTQNLDFAGSERAIREMLVQAERMAAQGGEMIEEAVNARLIGRNRLALALHEQGRWLEAVEATRALLEDRRAHYGPDSVRLAVDFHNLARAQVAVGDVEAALANEQRAAELLRENGDGESVRMGFITTGITLVHLEAGRLDAAQQSLDQARALFTAGLPAGSPRFRALDALEARIWVRQGNAVRAIERLGRLLAGSDLSADEKAGFNRDLAYALLSAGDWHRAHDAFAKAHRALTPQFAPLVPYFEAAIAFTGFRAGLGEDPPRKALEDARDTMRATGYDRIREYRNIEQWLDELAGMSHGG